MQLKQIFFYVLIRSWKNFRFLKVSLNSVLSQDYKNYTILYVDDASKFSENQRMFIKKKLKGHKVVFNKKRLYSPRNAYKMIHKYAIREEAVVISLDGDDWFLTDTALSTIAKVYQKNPKCLLTWGECRFWDGKELSLPSRLMTKTSNTAYPKKAVKKKTYRRLPFLPLGPRSWKVWLYKEIKKKDLQDPDGNWISHVEDLSMFFPMLEMANGKFEVIEKPIYAYNVVSKYSGMKTDMWGVIRDELIVRKKRVYETKI